MSRGKRRSQRPSQPLRIGSHNLGGVQLNHQAPKLLAAVQLWARQRLDIVCLQETHLSTFSNEGTFKLKLDAATTALHVAPWRMVAFKYATVEDPYSGVAILVRSDLLDSNRLKAASPLVPAAPSGGAAAAAALERSRSPSPSGRSPSPPPAAPTGAAGAGAAGGSGAAAAAPAAQAAGAVPAPAAPAPALDPRTGGGRLATYSFRWRGHHVHLTNVYLPARNSGSRTAFIKQHLAPVLASATPGQHLLAGDFNFVAGPLDSSAGDGRVVRDGAAARALAAAGPTLVDVHRARYPNRADYTHTYVAPAPGGSRIDRLYVTRRLLPWVFGSAIEVDSPSDHRLPCLQLLPKAPDARGPGLRRVRMGFASQDDLREQLEGWLGTQLLNMPPEDPADVAGSHGRLLEWWPGFKRRLAAQVAALNRTAQLRRLDAGRQAAEARAALRAAQAAAAGPNAAADAVVGVVVAQAALSAALRRAAASAAVRARVAWVREGERPNPAITAMIHPPRSVQDIGALRDAAGRLVSDPQRLPNVVASFWADICKAPTGLTTADQQAVLAAVSAHSSSIPAATAPGLGSKAVTELEVQRALEQTKPNTAPGWDGLPVDLYRLFSRQLRAVLARLFTAIGHLGTVPAGFLKGVITVLYKGHDADRMAAGNYRPITLLCTDYRLLARVLSNRLSPALAEVIPLEQSAFLPGRSIGANTRFLRCLPPLLQQQHRSAIVAFLDFAKAYDTIDRGFLFALMEQMGVGDDFLAWARLLLGHTTAVAVVNGYFSRPVSIRAGVRQGCPLAPLLYLFIAHALLCWLKQHGVGTQLDPADPSSVAPGCQFADDTQAVLTDAAAVPPFLELMETFARASGQHLNPHKVELLPVGEPSPRGAGPVAAGAAAAAPLLPPAAGAGPSGGPVPAAAPAAAGDDDAAPSTIAGLRVVTTANALGIPFTNPPALPAVAGAKQLPGARTRMTKISRMGLSMFGRATAASTYALQMSTYHMEHSGLPPPAVLGHTMATVAKLVDRALGPDEAARRFTGVPLRLLPGHPTVGGFGVLPLEQHVRSRHAKWTIALVLSELQPVSKRAPWARIVAAYLAGLHPAFTPMAALTAVPAGPWLGANHALPADILRAVASLGPPLPAVEDVGAAPLAPGEWCFNAPLWGNPLLPNAGAPGRRPGLERLHVTLTQCRALRTVGDAVRVHAALVAFEMAREDDLKRDPSFAVVPRWAVAWRRWLPQHLAPSPSAFSSLQDRTQASGALAALLGDISPAWLAAARAVVARLTAPAAPAPPTPAEVAALLLPRLGWRLGPDCVLTLKDFTVKMGTHLQLAELGAARLACHTEYVREALGAHASAASVEAATVRLRGTFRRLWQRVKWEPQNKEVFWRLAVDGVAMPGSSHLPGVPLEPCACGCFPGPAGAAESPRLHHFWTCPLVKPLLEVLEEGCGCGVGRAHVWLCVSPAPARVLPCVWGVVALAALNALEWARRLLHARRPYDPALPAAVRLGVVAKFWALLQDFTGLGVPSKGWDAVSASHPFLRVVGGRLVCAGAP